MEILRSRATSETLGIIQEFKKNAEIEETAKVHEMLMSYSLTYSKEMTCVLDIFKGKMSDLVNRKLELYNELYFEVVEKICVGCCEDVKNLIEASSNRCIYFRR